MSENLAVIQRTAIEPAYSLLPERMKSIEATALLYAIGLQESRFRHRRQVRGPARGYWQFERGGGVQGVLSHPASRAPATEVCRTLHYPADGALSETTDAVYGAIEHNDVLAACFARLLLWTDSRPLPTQADGPEAAWDYYIRNWRPGKPHPGTWQRFWEIAWESA